MNDQELLEAQKKLDELYVIVEHNVHPSVMPLINKYSNLQLKIEKECNK